MAAEVKEALATPAELERRASQAWPLSADKYELQGEIGSGAFGVVCVAQLKGRKERVAIKILDLEALAMKWEDVFNEISVTRQMDNPNIVKPHTVFVNKQELWIVMPLLAHGSCSNIMRKHHPKGFKDPHLIATIMKEVLKALAYVHAEGRIHRDVKAGNILISSEVRTQHGVDSSLQGEVKLADFGVAGTLLDEGRRKKQRGTFTGTPCWMAPEVMEDNKGYDEKADIWSAGITALELGFGAAPYAHMHPMKVLIETLQKPPPTCDMYKDQSCKFPKSFRSFVSKCLQKIPGKRKTAAELLKHKFFQKVRSRVPGWADEGTQYAKEDSATLMKRVICDVIPVAEIHKIVRTSEGDKRKSAHQAPVVVSGDWIFPEDVKKSVHVGRFQVETGVQPPPPVPETTPNGGVRKIGRFQIES